MKKSNPILLTSLVLLVLGPLVAFAAAQSGEPVELPRRTEALSWDSGSHNGMASSRSARLASSQILFVPGVPWMQLQFGMGRLGTQSRIEITSLLDGATQTLDAQSFKEWNNHSAYFNGEAVEIRLFVGPQDQGIRARVKEVVVGEWATPSQESICGIDNRVASSEARVARIDPIGCTGWVISNGKQLTAGHCLDGSGNTTLSFNVPPSLSGGTVQFPGPEDQYSINQGSFEFTNGGIGNDWGVFSVADNSVTGLQPVAAQGSFNIRQDLGPSTIRITGFGVDDGTTNQTNQTHAGPNAGSSGTTMRYATDTTGGNSGSPVIDDATGEAVGIHTHGGCTSGGGNNSGTSFFNSAAWTAIDIDGGPPPPGGVCSFDNDFESSNTTGWSNDAASTCTTGTYVIGNPTQQISTIVTQPAGSASGTKSIFTASNTSAGVNDVDGGNCILSWAGATANAASTLSVSYFHGQRDTGDDPSGDFFNIQYRVDGGGWSNLVSNGDTRSTASWATASTTVSPGLVELRMQCSDGSGPGDIVECGIDDVKVCEQ